MKIKHHQHFKGIMTGTTRLYLPVRLQSKEKRSIPLQLLVHRMKDHQVCKCSRVPISLVKDCNCYSFWQSSFPEVVCEITVRKLSQPVHAIVDSFPETRMSVYQGDRGRKRLLIFTELRFCE